MVEVRKFSLGVVQDIKGQGYKWTKASDDDKKIKQLAEDYPEAVLVHNTDTGLWTLYTKGTRLYLGSQFGKYPVRHVEKVGGEVIVTPIEGEEMKFKSILAFEMKEPVTPTPPPDIIEDKEAVPGELPMFSKPVQVGTPKLKYQASIPGIKTTPQAKFGDIPDMPKPKKEPKPKPQPGTPEYFYTTLEKPGEAAGPESELKPKKPKKEKEREETDIFEFLSWSVLGVGGALGMLKGLDMRSGVYR